MWVENVYEGGLGSDERWCQRDVVRPECLERADSHRTIYQI